MLPENSGDIVKPRQVIIDVQLASTRKNEKARSRRNKNKNQKSRSTCIDDDSIHDEKTDNHYPVEMQLIIRAAQEYARRTYVLGILEATNSFAKIADKIRSMGPEITDMRSTALDIDGEVEKLRSRAFAACNLE